MTLKHTVIAVAAICTVAGAGAQTQTPGLWESTMTIKSQGGEIEGQMAALQARLAAMPPAQRAQVEQMMASRGVGIGAQGTTVKACISKEQAARPPEARLMGNCTQSDVKRSGNTMTFKFDCTQPQPSSGEGTWTFLGDKAFTGKMLVSAQVGGKPQQLTMNMSGKWVSADCGGIKPLETPAK